jgi:O-antigen/teichoic acid export membrane protein
MKKAHKIIGATFPFLGKVIEHPLFSGSLVMVVGLNLTNFFAYIYHFLIGRMLGPSLYGELSSVIGILTIVFTLFSFLSLVVVKFSSSEEDAEALFVWLKARLLLFSAGLGGLILLASPFLSSYLGVDILLVMIVAPITAISVLGIVYRSYLQGKMHFGKVVVASNLDMASRLLVSFTLVYLGYKVIGALFGVLLGGALGLIFLDRSINRISLTNGERRVAITGAKLRKILLFVIPVFVTSLSTNLMMTIDILMAKHYLDSASAGIYSSLSTLGRIIFYAAGPISSVSFPLISASFSKGKPFYKYFYLSLALTIFLCLSILVLYLIFPSVAIGVLFGEEFLQGSYFLVWFGLFMFIFTISQLFMSFFLSIESTNIVYVALPIVFIQFFGIMLFHSNILDIVKVNLFSVTLLLCILVIYFLYEKRFRFTKP